MPALAADCSAINPLALCPAHELLRARHLALNATQQIAPLFDTQFPVLLTDIAVLNTFALATPPGYLRARWLLPAPHEDHSTFDTWRTLLHADCSALFTLRPALNPFHSFASTSPCAANTDFSMLSAQFSVPTADCAAFNTPAVHADLVSLRARRFALAPNANYFALDT